VRNLPLTSIFQSSTDAIINIILDLWERHINIDAICVCALLSFDKRVDRIFPGREQFSRHWFVNFAAQYALYWHITDSDDDDIDLLKARALSEWSSFRGTTHGSCFDQLDNDIEVLRSQYPNDRAAHARAVWSLYLSDAPIITHAAVAILSISGSEAAVERTFSAQGLVHSDLRNRMGDATVEAEMFIKFKQRTVEGVEGKKRKKILSSLDSMGYCAEMGDDYAEDEAPPTFVGVFSRPEAKAEEDEDRVPEVEEEKGQIVPAVISHIPRPPPVDDVQAFIEHIVADMGVTPKYRWTEARMNQLESEGQQWQPAMRDTVDVLKKRIMAWVRAQDAEENAQDPLSVEV